jgi:hypothetical protein
MSMSVQPWWMLNAWWMAYLCPSWLTLAAIVTIVTIDQPWGVIKDIPFLGFHTPFQKPQTWGWSTWNWDHMMNKNAPCVFFGKYHQISMLFFSGVVTKTERLFARVQPPANHHTKELRTRQVRAAGIRVGIFVIVCIYFHHFVVLIVQYCQLFAK